MVRINERPRWKRILFLERIAVLHKRSIVLEGYLVLPLLLTLPVWIWTFTPMAFFIAWAWTRDSLERHRRSYYGGVNIDERSTARPRWHWLRRRRSLSRARPSPKSGSEPVDWMLSRLPQEIRRQILLYVVQPADELTICSMGRRRKQLVALPTLVWNDAYSDAHGTGSKWDKLQRILHGTNFQYMAEISGYACRDILTLAKVNRRTYAEIIPMIYGDNVFHFHPLRDTRQAASIEHFLAFTHSIPAARLQDVRHIRLRPSFTFFYVPSKKTYLLDDDAESRWKRTCSVLKQMTRLSTLHIRVASITYRTGLTWSSRRAPVGGQSPENRMLRHLVGVSASRDCFVETPCRKEDIGQMRDVACEVRESHGAVSVVEHSLLNRT